MPLDARTRAHFDLSRREFLAFAGMAGGAVVLAACGGSKSGGADAAHSHGEPTELAPATMSIDVYASGLPQRFAFAMLAKEGFASGAPVQVGVAPDNKQPSEFVATKLYEKGLPPKRGVYVAELIFDHAGVWNAVGVREGERLPFLVQVKARPEAPVAGAQAPTAASPTPTDPLGVDPICTRDPQCPLHERSLDALVGKGRPVAVLFATPARCQSQYCAPVLDALLPLVDAYRDKIDIVHVEIYKDLRSPDLVPTVEAWNLPGEPFLFGIDPSGLITARIDGAMGTDEMRALLDNLAATGR